MTSRPDFRTCTRLRLHVQTQTHCVDCSDDEALVQPQLSSSLGAEELTQDEDEQQEQLAPPSDSMWSSRDFHMSPKQGMQHTKGMKLVPALTSNDACVANPTCSVLLHCGLC